MKSRLFKPWQNRGCPALRKDGTFFQRPAAWKISGRFVVLMQGQSDLPQVILTLDPPRRFPGRVNSGQQQCHEYRNDADRHQQFQHGKPSVRVWTWPTAMNFRVDEPVVQGRLVVSMETLLDSMTVQFVVANVDADFVQQSRRRMMATAKTRYDRSPVNSEESRLPAASMPVKIRQTNAFERNRIGRKAGSDRWGSVQSTRQQLIDSLLDDRCTSGKQIQPDRQDWNSRRRTILRQPHQTPQERCDVRLSAVCQAVSRQFALHRSSAGCSARPMDETKTRFRPIAAETAGADVETFR